MRSCRLDRVGSSSVGRSRVSVHDGERRIPPNLLAALIVLTRVAFGKPKLKIALSGE